MASIDIEDLDKTEEESDEQLKEASGLEDEAQSLEEPGGEALDGLPDDDLERAVQEAASNYEKYLRAVADLENYKKRAEKERIELKKYANEKLLLEVLPVTDNLQRALDHVDGDEPNNLASLTEGVSMTIDQLFKVLAQFGLTEVKAVGEKFDPEFHHAISHDNTTDAEPGTIVSVFQKGYILKGRLIRPAMVSVANDE